MDDLSSFMMSADELDVDSLELPVIPPPAPPMEPQKASAAAAAAAAAADQSRNGKKAKPRSPSPIENELGLVTPPAAGPPLWRVTESVEDFYGNADSFNSPELVQQAQPVQAVAAPPPTAPSPIFTNPPVARTPEHGAADASRVAPRARRTPPQPDDWAYFDPSQSAFKALTRRLDEIAGAA
jgi:hypothetical protein